MSPAPKKSALERFAAKIDHADKPAIEAPRVKSFREFLDKHGRVLTKDGARPFSFAGRQPLAATVAIIDDMLGSTTGKPLKDASLAICGGAQFGKTILAMHLLVYAMGVRFLRAGYYLPDDDLVQGLVDTKLRPEIIDLMPWLGSMMSIGKTVNESGRAVNRKGAFMATDGKHTGLGYMRGMGKIPTSFSMDLIIEDEKDDIPDRAAKFLPGRLSSSDLRLRFSIGTQRIFGAGQQKEFEEGTQHVGTLTCSCGRRHNPEEDFPAIVRMMLDHEPRLTDPQLTHEGDFKSAAASHVFDHEARYYFACVDCGRELEREAIAFEARRPERAAQRKYSIRISQLSTPAIDLKQIVADWCNNAVRDPEAMRSFRCDRLAIPKSTAQKIEPAVIERARSLAPYDLTLKPRDKAPVFCGLDTGDRCWFTARDVASPLDKRVTWAEQLSAERCRERVPLLFATLGASCLFVDAGPLRDLARDLCLLLQPKLRDVKQTPQIGEGAYINFGDGLSWDGPNGRWLGLKCAAVEFTQKDGAGVRHKLGVTQDGQFYPIIAANRDETIQTVVDELLTPAEDVIEVVAGKIRSEPALRLPAKRAGSAPAVDLLAAHIMTGARKQPDDKGSLHFVDQVENHFLLSLAYGRLAERIGGNTKASSFAFRRIEAGRNAALDRVRERKAVLL